MMDRRCLICRTDLSGARSDARFCSPRCRKRWHRRPAELRVEFVSDPWLPMSDEQIEHERVMLVTACRQTRACGCETPFTVADIDGHSYCLKCSWPIEAAPHGLLQGVFRLIARLTRYARPATIPQPQ
jgi:hypothetical protein